MAKTDVKHFSVTVDPELHEKFKYVCGYDGRSLNKQVIQLMKQCVENHEKKHGPIPLETDKED